MTMEASRKSENLRNFKTSHASKAQVGEAASVLLNESKKKAHELYDENLAKVNHAEEQLRDFSDKLVIKVKENPVSSVLIAAGLGFLLSKILK